jgi:hypothetical protein
MTENLEKFCKFLGTKYALIVAMYCVRRCNLLLPNREGTGG